MKKIAFILGVLLVLTTAVAAGWRTRDRAASPPRSSAIQHDADSGSSAPNPTVQARPTSVKAVAGTRPTSTSTPRPTAAPRPAAKPTLHPAAPKGPARYMVLIVLDGARPDYFTVPGIPHVRALMRTGTVFTNAFAGILESETPSGHATIGSGSRPRSDGILSFDWANNDNTTVDLFDPAHIRDGQMERILNAAPAPSIAELVHLRDKTAKVVALGGHKYYAQDAMGGPDANVIMYYTGTKDGKFVPVAVPGHVPPASILQAPGLTAKSTSLPLGTEDHLAMRLARVTFSKLHERVALMNLPEFDWPLGHVDGASADHAGVVKLMQGFDRDLGLLEDEYRKAGVLQQTLFVITADHGFATIHHTVADTDIQNAVTRAGTSIVSDTYHTAGYIWIRDDERGAAAAENIAHLQNRYIQSVYFREQMPNDSYHYLRATGPELFKDGGTENANQYLLDSFAGPTSPDLVVFFTEGAASLPGGQSSWKGDHGGASWESQHVPMILSGPGVRRGVVSDRPAPLMDLAPTALSIMNMPTTGMEGTPLADAISWATPAMRAASDRQARSLQPIVDALKRESRLELTAQ